MKQTFLRSDQPKDLSAKRIEFNHALHRTGAMRLSFVSHWFYNIIGFGERVLSAPVAELGRSATIRSGPGIVKPLSQREAAMNIRRVPLLVILVVVLAQHAGVIMLAGK